MAMERTRMHRHLVDLVATHVGGEAHEGRELEVVETHLTVEIEHPK